jgi:hypothetical protein
MPPRKRHPLDRQVLGVVKAQRKLWSTTVVGNRRRHESRAQAYRYVENDRRNWLAGALRDSVVNVWVDERDGRGWQLYERIDFAGEGK